MMVGGTDNYCIEFGLLKQFSVIEEFFCDGEAIAGSVKGIGIGIAQSDDVFGADCIQIAGTAAPDTDGTDIEPIVGTEDPVVGAGRVGNKACGRSGEVAVIEDPRNDRRDSKVIWFIFCMGLVPIFLWGCSEAILKGTATRYFSG